VNSFKIDTLVTTLLATVLVFSTHGWAQDPFERENEQIRRDKFDQVLPEVMREHSVDMWIHIMREEVPDEFGAAEFGDTSGVFIFTDRGEDRIERAVLGRRWGARQRERIATEFHDPILRLDAYDIVSEPIRIQEPPSGPVTEYDLRFEGLHQFVKTRNPQRIAVNFKHKLGQWPTYIGESDGISHTDYLLLADELGEKFAGRLVSSEFVQVDYSVRKVPSEIALLKIMRERDVEATRKMFASIMPGVTRSDEIELTTLRRMSTGLSQRGRSAGWEDSVVQGGDILVQPLIGMYAYVLRDGETEPPTDVRKLWAEYLEIDKVLAQTIKAGLTPRQIIDDYTKKFNELGIIIRADQMHMVLPKNDFTAYTDGYDASKTHLTIDSHGQVKGARSMSEEALFAPRIGSYGPDWTIDKPLAPNHHFVLEYFFYMPSVASKDKDQYLLWWDHEEAIATEEGVEYLSPPQTELILIK